MTAMLEQLLEVGFVACLAIVVSTYVGYPLTLMLLPRRQRSRTPPQEPPTVTVVIAAYNEAAHIGATVMNKLSQQYAAGRLDVLVVSDGSTDGTDQIVRDLAAPNLTLVRQAPRQGKTSALNRALEVASGEIVVFSDANSMYRPDAVAALAREFDDPHVGYATGHLIYCASGETAVGEGSGIYMRYENWLRDLESGVGSVVGVNGGIDAVRRSLYKPMRPDQLPDFVLPLRVAAGGSRVVYCQDAVSREEALGRQTDEFQMRVRVSLRALHALWDMRYVLRPKYGLFAFQLLMHKVARYLLFIPLGLALLFSALLSYRPEFLFLFVLQIAFYALAAIGWRSGGRIRAVPVFIPFYFCLINGAAAFALLRFLRGDRQVVWTPRKGA